MSNAEFRTTLLHRCLDRLRAGDDAAYDELIRHAGERLNVLASRMLRHFPVVRRREDTPDVLQSAHVRLLRDLRDKAKRPASVRDFFNLAAAPSYCRCTATTGGRPAPARPSRPRPTPTWTAGRPSTRPWSAWTRPGARW